MSEKEQSGKGTKGQGADDERLVARLRVENASLRRENRYLRRVTRESRHGRMLRRTHVDAKQLLVWRFAGITICRRECGEMGMSQRRWQWARALLMTARLHDGRDLVMCEFEGAVRALEASVHHLEQKGLAALRLRMPRSAFGGKGEGGRGKSEGEVASHHQDCAMQGKRNLKGRN
ncbi:MAG: hypothetical protein KDE46_17790 [Caldilineaceae bacterium]|nr:hypothetical protein [Caldilineaceae bacterium]